MIEKKNLLITKHAYDKMIIEGINANQICQAIDRGAKFIQTDGYLSVYTYFAVAWKKIGVKHKIKTVFVNK